jgi:RHS repeat-associated protein
MHMDHIANMAKPRTAFSGESSEEALSFYLLGGRAYCPSIRRFAAPDALSPFDDGGLNRYAYCSCDPVNRIDPSGGSFWEWLGVAVGIGLAVAAAIASGGALLGAVGAAGGLGAALATSSGAVAASAAVLDVAAIGVPTVIRMARTGMSPVVAWIPRKASMT